MKKKEEYLKELYDKSSIILANYVTLFESYEYDSKHFFDNLTKNLSGELSEIGVEIMHEASTNGVDDLIGLISKIRQHNIEFVLQLKQIIQSKI